MKKLNYKRSALLFSVAFGLIGSLSLSAESAFLSEEDLYEEDVLNGSGVSDPLESINRVTFDINDFVYLNLLQPIADGYTAITP
ncbi:MAG: MlaA family lipoprotein, partial [Opitutales bacterium]|nr:MlaA family lipoprotein [Opitutales bacterium]